MGTIGPRAVLTFVIGWMILAVILGVIASWAGLLWHLLTGQRVLPEGLLIERRRTPWGSGTVLIAFLLYLATNILAYHGYMWATGASPGEASAVMPATPLGKPVEEKDTATEDVAADGLGDADVGSPTEPPPAGPKARKLTMIEMMTVQMTVNAILVVLLPMAVRVTSGARLRDLGLSLVGWRRQVALGVVSVLVLMPIVYGSQYLAIRVLGYDDALRHPVEKMFEKEFSGELAILAILSAVVVAPLFEELMFRSIFQTWLVDILDRSWKYLRDGSDRPEPSLDTASPRQLDPDIPSDLAESVGLDESSPFPEDSPPPAYLSATSPDTTGASEAGDWAEDLARSEPDDRPVAHGSSAHDPVPPIAKRSRPDTHSPVPAFVAIVITSAIFASLHAAQWPAPIPIFILALGLGFIYHRTGSLLAVICMHAVFNGTSTLTLFLGLLQGVLPAGEKEIPPTAIEHKISGDKVKFVVREPAGWPDGREKRIRAGFF